MTSNCGERPWFWILMQGGGRLLRQGLRGRGATELKVLDLSSRLFRVIRPGIQKVVSH